MNNNTNKNKNPKHKYFKPLPSVKNIYGDQPNVTYKKFNFGRHKGKMQNEVPLSYLYWCRQNIKNFQIDKKLMDIYMKYEKEYETKKNIVMSEEDKNKSIINSYYGFKEND